MEESIDSNGKNVIKQTVENSDLDEENSKESRCSVKDFSVFV